ncbi:ferric reductase-like transmembrane domain-containing protein [Thioclava sp. 15-R06ZXC-3]|uniref:Ferric reductase-like transmembrane domain-containing protein n=1 Tax=Thioclava arctica TaxID=3238301 RepID=A0ABV3TPB8_9RHOB
MTKINIRLFWGFWGVAAALWLVLNPEIFFATSVFALRNPMMQFSGVLAIAAMSVAMILSLRPRWLEAKVDGLDKMYRLHKWLGIGVLVLAVFHWLWSEAPKWAVGLGLLARGERGAGGATRDHRPDPEISYRLSWHG